MIEVVRGNLITMAEEGKVSHVLHGCNCWCTQGGGIARTISERYPEALVADQTTNAGDRHKLGSCTTASVRSVVDPSVGFTIINGYTQYNLSRGEDVFEYNAFERLCMYLEGRVLGPTDVLGMPLIGAGLARGDWERIRSIIERSFSSERRIVIVEWDGSVV